MTGGCLVSRTNVDRTCTGWRFPGSLNTLRGSPLAGFRIGGRSFIRTSGVCVCALGQVVGPVWHTQYPTRR